jgi:non-ribosomal peptide synthase protein (TIGR01720 family)
LLTDAHTAYATQINDLLIAAVACGWRAWTGERRCALTIEGHGREPLETELDLSRTIGWFTSFYPFAVELPANADTGGAIKVVKEALRAIPDRGAGYGILRYLTADGRRLPPLPPLAFNYLGQFDRDADGWFERAPEPGPATAAGDVRLPWPLELTAAVVEGRMELTLAYSARRYDAAAAASFLTLIQSELEGIVHHTSGRDATEHTASDFDYAGFSQEGLESFLRTL